MLWSITNDRRPRAKKAQALYGDILRYCAEIGTKPFTFTDLANWLIERHLPFRHEFEGTHYKKSYRIQSKRSFIQGRIDEMLVEGYLIQSGTKKAQKNMSKIPVYKFEQKAFLEAYRIIKHEERKENQMLINILSENASSKQDQSEAIFFLKLIEKMKQIGDNDSLASLTARLEGWRATAFRLVFPWLDNGDASGMDEYLPNWARKKANKKLFMEILEALDPQTRSFFLFALKLSIEDMYYGFYPTHEWEAMRYENASNNNKVVLQTECTGCHSLSPTVVEVDELLTRHFGSIDMSHKFDCKNCGKDRTCIIKNA